MVKLNKSTRFALYSIVELSKDMHRILTAKQIADKYGVSEHHVIKVLQHLAKAGMVRSIRGVNGGFQLAADPKELTMLDIVKTIEPQIPHTACVLLEDNEACRLTEACRIGDVLNEIQEQAYYTLKSITIATLISPPKIS